MVVINRCQTNCTLLRVFIFLSEQRWGENVTDMKVNPGLNADFPGLVWAGWAFNSEMRNIMAAINL